jgi:hypothetical protein
LIAFVFSSVAAKPFGSFLSTKIIFPSLRNYFIESLKQKVDSIELATLPEEGLGFLEQFHFSKEDLQQFISSQASSGEEVLENLADTIVKPVSDSVGHAIALVLLFIACALVIRILVRVLDLISKLPILNFSNQTLGLFAGILWGVLLSVFLSSVLQLIEPVLQGSENQFLSTFEFEKTYLVQLFSSFDFLCSVWL